MPGDEARRRYLGTIGRTYQVVQDEDALSFFDAALGQGAACVSAVGRLGRYGARTFVVASVPEMLEIVPGDPVERHIMLTTTHDGSGPIEAIFVNFRVASGSVLYTPVEGHQGRVRIKHTKNAESRVKVAHKVLHSNQEYWDRAIRAYRYLAKKDANEQRVRDFLAAMFPDLDDEDAPAEGEEKAAPRTSAQAERSREEIRNLFETSQGSEIAGKTDWGLFNAVAFFVDHERKLSKTQQKHGISRWEVSMFGPGSNLRQRAFTWLANH
jgi:phage/plasmid-like protein (TIGR03299 family)